MCRLSCGISDVDATHSGREKHDTSFFISSTEKYSSRRRWLPTAGSSLPLCGALLEIQPTDKTVITTLWFSSLMEGNSSFFELSKRLGVTLAAVKSMCKFTLCFRSVPDVRNGTALASVAAGWNSQAGSQLLVDPVHLHNHIHCAEFSFIWAVFYYERSTWRSSLNTVQTAYFNVALRL